MGGSILDLVITEEFEQHYKDSQQRVYHLTLSLTGNEDDAEEITQEAFARALRYYSSFRKESSFFTWICKITIHEAKDYMKKRNKMPQYALTEDYGYSLEEIKDENASDDPEAMLLAKEARYKCLHCLTECLPLEQRKIFCLAITLGLPHKMVAEIMECSVSKVKTSLYRAKKRWFGYMENRCDLIKKANPCNCSQWVRFGIKQGWIKPKEAKQSLPSTVLEVNRHSLAEVKNLKALRDLYTTLYPNQMSESLSERIRRGIQNEEWTIFCNRQK